MKELWWPKFCMDDVRIISKRLLNFSKLLFQLEMREEWCGIRQIFLIQRDNKLNMPFVREQY